MALYEIGYDGFIIVDAKSIAEAEKMANKILSDSKVPNDGNYGEWYLTSSERV